MALDFHGFRRSGGLLEVEVPLADRKTHGFVSFSGRRHVVAGDTIYDNGLCVIFGEEYGDPRDRHRHPRLPLPRVPGLERRVAQAPAFLRYRHTLLSVALHWPAFRQLPMAQDPCGGPRGAWPLQCSVPFILGDTLAYGPQRQDAYGDEHLGDAAILGISDE